MKCSYDATKIESGVPGIVILSHGPLALGLKESSSMIFGETTNFAAFSLEYGDDVTKYADTFIQAIESYGRNVLIMVDLFGGTPCNQLLIYAKKNNLKFNLLSGANLPMVISALTLRPSFKNADDLKNAVCMDINEYVKDISEFC